MTRRAILLAVVLALVACGESAKAAQPPLVVGAVYPTTGPQADGGKEELTGVRAAFALAERSGALKRNVQLRIVDAETPDQAAAAVDRLVKQDHVTAIIGTYGSTLSDAAAGRANALGVLYWETGAVADVVTRNRQWVFRTVATGGSFGRMSAQFTGRYLVPGQHVQAPTAAIVQVDDIYGASVAGGEAASAAAFGIKVVDRIKYDPRAFDPDAIARRLAADHADYLWDVSYLDDGVALWRAILGTSWRPRAAIGTSSAFCMPEFGRRLGAQALGIYAADKPFQGMNPNALDPAARTLSDQALAQFKALGGGSSMEIPGTAGFVGGWVFFHDVLPRVTGTVTSSALRDAALRLDLPLGSQINGGGVHFGPAGSADQGQNQRAASVIGQWLSVGVMKPVYPAGYATAEPNLSL